MIDSAYVVNRRFNARVGLNPTPGSDKKNGSIIFYIDHIDGNSENNNENNLILLCPNCHALTHTFGGLNMGNSNRKERKLRYKKGISSVKNDLKNKYKEN